MYIMQKKFSSWSSKFWFMSKILTTTAGKVAGELVGRQLWRVDRVNKFLEVPQCWVTSFDSPLGERAKLSTCTRTYFAPFPDSTFWPRICAGRSSTAMWYAKKKFLLDFTRIFCWFSGVFGTYLKYNKNQLFYVQ